MLRSLCGQKIQQTLRTRAYKSHPKTLNRWSIFIDGRLWIEIRGKEWPISSSYWLKWRLSGYRFSIWIIAESASKKPSNDSIEKITNGQMALNDPIWTRSWKCRQSILEVTKWLELRYTGIFELRHRWFEKFLPSSSREVKRANAQGPAPSVSLASLALHRKSNPGAHERLLWEQA